MSKRNQSVVVASRATSIPRPENFRVVDLERPRASPEGVVVRVLYAAVDPAMRGYLSAEKNYLTIADGAVMRANGIGEIVETQNPHWKVGEQVYGYFGWQQYFAAGANDLLWRVNEAIAPLPVWLGSLGWNGITAWIGFRHHGRPRAGETVLVSTAAGAVGSVVGQLARVYQLRAVGLTSNPEKVALATAAFGYDKAIDYRTTTDLAAAIAAACPNGVDIYYDNVAGVISDAVFRNLNPRARVVQCGTASVPSWNPPPTGPRRERDVLIKRLSWHGFIVVDHRDLFQQALAELTQLYRSGNLQSREDILHGLDAAPAAIEMLYSGRNHGRLCIAV